MLAYNLNYWLQLFHREKKTTVEAIAKRPGTERAPCPYTVSLWGLGNSTVPVRPAIELGFDFGHSLTPIQSRLAIATPQITVRTATISFVAWTAPIRMFNSQPTDSVH